MIVNQVLDAAKKAVGIDTDYQLAKALGLSTAYLTRYRKEQQTPDAYVCTRLAEMLGVEPFELLAEIEAETEKNPVRRAFWEGKRKTGQSAKTDPLYAWRARRDSNARPLPSESKLDGVKRVAVAALRRLFDWGPSEHKFLFA